MPNSLGSGVSVVVPTFNRSQMLSRALESIETQTYPFVEIIVVDDGSTDDTAELVERRFPMVNYLRQDHRGVSAARNNGILAASGDWIALLDSDDEWAQDKLDRQVAALRERPEYKVCHTDELWVRNGRRVNPMLKHAKTGGTIYDRCLPLCAISPSSALIHRTVFDDVGLFDEYMPVCEDYDMWLRVCCRYPVLYVEEPLVVKFGGHPDQLSRQYWGMDRFRIRALEKILGNAYLDDEQRMATIDVLIEKIEIYLNGARKRRKLDEVDLYARKKRWYESVQEEVAQRCRNIG